LVSEIGREQAGRGQYNEPGRLPALKRDFARLFPDLDYVEDGLGRGRLRVVVKR
jgi:hypothetical protein